MAKQLKDKLRQGKLTKAFCLGQLCHPKYVEIVAGVGGFDAVWLDQEHAGLSIAQIEQASLAARAAGLDCFVRLAPTDYATVMRCLEAGAGGVMAAQIRSAQQARDFVQWAHFHPIGLRGVNGSGVDGGFGTIPLDAYVQQAQERTFVGIQIEHIDAVHEVEAIASIPGVDILFMGPADLAQSMGLLGQWEHPELWKCIERVAEAARHAKVAWGIMPRNPAQAQRCVAMGAKMLFVGMDVWALQRGLRSFVQEFASLTP